MYARIWKLWWRKLILRPSLPQVELEEDNQKWLSMDRGDIVSPKRYDYGDDVHYDLIVVEKILDS